MCMVDNADGSWEQWWPSIRKARKAHRCMECGRDIEPGERYEHMAYKYEGEFSYCKTCRHCMAARRWLVVVCGGFLYCTVKEDLAEHFEESPRYRTMDLGRRIVGMRRKWRRRDGALMDELPDFDWQKLPNVRPDDIERLQWWGQAGSAGKP